MSYKSSYTGPQIDSAIGEVLAKTDQQMLAPILSDPAGQAVSAGQYFIYNNVLRKALQAISSSATAATFTGNTYSEVVSGGGLNDVVSSIGLHFLSGTVSNVSISIPVGMTEIRFPALSNVPAVKPKFIWLRIPTSKVVSSWECYPTHTITDAGAWYFNVFSQKDSAYTLTTYDYVVAY